MDDYKTNGCFSLNPESSDVEKISEYVERYLPGENPLSADIFRIEYKGDVWLFDVGASDGAAEYVNSVYSYAKNYCTKRDYEISSSSGYIKPSIGLKDIQIDELDNKENNENKEVDDKEGKKINVVISHFHGDHLANIERVRFDELYVGRNTYVYTKKGIIVEDFIYPYGAENKDFCIFPLPSSHAKGCIALLAYGMIFTGDGVYPAQKKDQKTGEEKEVFNVQFLKEQIELVEKLDADTVVLSHKRKSSMPKKVLLAFLKKIYDKRDKASAYIDVERAGRW